MIDTWRKSKQDEKGNSDTSKKGRQYPFRQG